ncbi:CU044_2847 family protein [Microbacterium deminutum]|uniref:Trypsin-co-occurring domain-containing protein n=1 Tax=Microbacterium deminutum TaxID=344164 RepID=A0ABP5C224_9MICO
MKLVTYTTSDGEEVTIQVPDAAAQPDLVTRGWGGATSTADTVQRAEVGLDSALARIQPAVRSLIAQLRAQTDNPDEIQVEFGIQLSVGFGAFISAGTTSNFRVLMTWHPLSDRIAAEAEVPIEPGSAYPDQPMLG